MSISPKWKWPIEDAIRDFGKSIMDNEEISEEYVSFISEAIEKVESQINDTTVEGAKKAECIYKATFDLLVDIYVTFKS